MKIIKLYESVINEAKMDVCVKNFGQQLFGSKLGGTEKDTRLEKSYADLIAKFSSEEYGKNINPKFVEAINQLKGCVGQFKEVLVPENTQIYRGLTIPISYFIKTKQPLLAPNDQPVDFQYKYQATSPIQSWSTSPDIAALFGNNDEINELGEQLLEGNYTASVEKAQQFFEHVKVNYSGLRIPVILTFQTNAKDFLFKSKYFKILSNNTHEDEVLRISNKPTLVSARFNNHEDVFLTYGGMMVLKVISKFV